MVDMEKQLGQFAFVASVFFVSIIGLKVFIGAPESPQPSQFASVPILEQPRRGLPAMYSSQILRNSSGSRNDGATGAFKGIFVEAGSG